MDWLRVFLLCLVFSTAVSIRIHEENWVGVAARDRRIQEDFQGGDVDASAIQRSSWFNEDKTPHGGNHQSEYRVLSYNICWGCTTGNSSDTSGLKGNLKRCLKKTKSGVTECAENIGNSIEQFSKKIGGYDFIALQEGQGHKSLRLEERELNVAVAELDPKVYDSAIPVVTYYNKDRLGKFDQSVSGALEADRARPFLVLIFDSRRLIFVNIHNMHLHKGVNVWKSFLTDVGNALADVFAKKADRTSYRVIIAGDFNDPYGSLPGCLTIPWNNVALHSAKEVPRTCCEHSAGKEPSGRGDYIFDSYSPSDFRVPRKHDLSLSQSDHSPVEAVLSSSRRLKAKDTSCCVRGPGQKCLNAFQMLAMRHDGWGSFGRVSVGVGSVSSKVFRVTGRAVASMGKMTSKLLTSDLKIGKHKRKKKGKR